MISWWMGAGGRSEMSANSTIVAPTCHKSVAILNVPWELEPRHLRRCHYCLCGIIKVP